MKKLPPTIRARAEQLLLQPRSGDYKQIAARLRKEYPGARTSRESVIWYASQMRRNKGLEVPDHTTPTKTGEKHAA